MKALLTVLLLLALLIIDRSVADDKPHLVRQRFLPGPTERGASFSALRPGPGKDGGFFLQAWAGIGDKFPVKNETGVTLFDVTVLDGDDDHLVMEIITKAETRKIDVKRDKSEPVIVSGTQYEVAYPSVSVNSTGKTTSNQAMLLVCIRP